MGSEEGKERTEDGKRRGRKHERKTSKMEEDENSEQACQTPRQQAPNSRSVVETCPIRARPVHYHPQVINIRESTQIFVPVYARWQEIDGTKLGLRCTARTRRADENTNGAGAAAKRRPSPFLAVRARLELGSLRKKRACTQRARKGYALPHPSCRSSSSTGSSRLAVPISSLHRTSSRWSKSMPLVVRSAIC